MDAAICFFLPYYTTAARGKHAVDDVFSVGKVAFIAMLGTVNLEVTLRRLLLPWRPIHPVS